MIQTILKGIKDRSELIVVIIFAGLVLRAWVEGRI
jgi:hypothetical protein